MYDGSGTVQRIASRQSVDAAAAGAGRTLRVHCNHRMAAHLKWRHGRHLERVTSNENPTPSVDTYLIEEHSCRISSADPNWNDMILGSCDEGRSNKKKNMNKNSNKMSSDVRSAPDPNTTITGTQKNECRNKIFRKTRERVAKCNTWSHNSDKGKS